MHEKRNSVIAVAGLALLIAVGIGVSTRPTEKKVNVPAPVPVQVINVVEEDVPRYVTGIGSVLSLQSVVIRPQVDGILTRLFVKEGQQVKPGGFARDHR